MTNIPIYRAKKIDSDEYIIGTHIKTQGEHYVFEDNSSDIYLDSEINFDDGAIDGEIRIINSIYEIDPTTLAIHFPDMLDNEGNKIFASLSEDGKGGDEMEYGVGGHNYKGFCIFKGTKVMLKDGGFINYFDYCTIYKVIGMQE